MSKAKKVESIIVIPEFSRMQDLIDWVRKNEGKFSPEQLKQAVDKIVAKSGV